jgi:hypothetical protein
MRYLSDQPILVTDEEIIGLTHDGLPKHLGALIELVREKEPNTIRYILTILQLSKFIK